MPAAYIEQVGEDPIFVVTFSPESKPVDCVNEMAVLIRERIEDLKAYVYAITDISDFPVSFFGILTSLAESRSEQNRFFDGKMSRYVVGMGKLAEMIVNGATQQQYGGNRDTFLAHTVEEAITAAQDEYRANGWRSLEL